MAKRFTIGVDIDGVLSNFTLAARNLCKEMFNGKPADHLVQTGWGFDSLGLTNEEEKAMWERIDSIPNWWMNHEKMPGTSRLKTMCDNHRVVFITNRKDGTGWPIEQQSAEWLKQNFWLYNPTVVISGNKGDVANGLELDFFIDDRGKNYTEVCEARPQCQSALYDATYNQDTVAGWRVENFDAFADYITQCTKAPKFFIAATNSIFKGAQLASNWSR